MENNPYAFIVFKWRISPLPIKDHNDIRVALGMAQDILHGFRQEHLVTGGNHNCKRLVVSIHGFLKIRLIVLAYSLSDRIFYETYGAFLQTVLYRY